MASRQRAAKELAGMTVQRFGDPDSATTFVLVHGWGSNGSAWAENVAAFAAAGDVLIPDLRGHGATPAGDAPLTLAGVADDLAVLVRQAGHGRIVVIGHSLGGALAALLADRHPGLVDALVVIDPSYGADDDEMATVPGRLVSYRSTGGLEPSTSVSGAFGSPRPDLALRAAHSLLTSDPRALAELFFSNYLADDQIGSESAARDWLLARDVRTLAFFPSDYRARLDRLAPQTAVEVWDGVGHFLHQERPSAFVTEVLGWLEA